MNYTENYQLPQWVETDRIMMDDFNEAMARVDQDCGNCRIVYGSYVGTGESRSAHPNTIITGFPPALVMISGGSFTVAFNRGNTRINAYTGSRGEPQVITWMENGISWYVSSGTGSPSEQLNEEGVTYYYVALG